jgi:hypothetical protein
MKKHILPIVIVLLALMLVLPGIAIARNSSSSNPDSSISDQPISAGLIGGKYNLIFKSAPAGSENSAVLANTLTTGSYSQSTNQTIRTVLQGGSYMLSQPGASPDQTGCCCRGYLSCVRKK